MVRLAGCLAGLFAVAAWLAPDTAFANGRFPSAQQLVIHPRDPNRIWQRATHGMLTSCDRGKTWSWICEESVGYRGTEDPAIAVTATGTFIATFFGALSQTTDNGCTFVPEPAIGPQNVEDVSVERNDPTRVLAVTSTGDSTLRWVNQVWRSTDSGASWAQLGQNFDPTLLAFTIDAAPSDPKTIYVTGASYIASDGGTEIISNGLILRSKDDGQSWHSTQIEGTSNEAQPFLSAVHPTDPNKLYVRVRGPDVVPPATGFVKNQLLYSEDGGESWTKILETDADMLAFALSPDGGEVFVGVGDSRLLVRPGDTSRFGLYRSPAPAFAFERISEAVHIGCLTFDGEELWVCSSQYHPSIIGGPTLGFEVGISRDRGGTIEKLMELADPVPLKCGCDSTTGDLCLERWNEPIRGVCVTIGRCTPEGSPVEASCGEPAASCSAGSGGSGNGGTASGSAGSGGSGAEDAGSGAGGSPVTGGNDEGGCGCRALGRASGRSLLTGALVLIALGAIRIFRRRG